MSIKDNTKKLTYLNENYIKALKRDNYSCINCGDDRLLSSDGRRLLVIHHLDESRKTGKLNNELNNLITLCKHCHGVIHSGTGDFSREIEIIELRESGMTFQEIADRFKVSRQFVNYLYHKAIGRENRHITDYKPSKRIFDPLTFVN